MDSIDANASEPQAYSWRNWLAGIGLGLCSVLGGLITVREPLWIDELHTYWVSSQELADVAPRARFGNQSPVWFWCEHFSLKILTSDSSSATSQQFALRLPSMLCWFAMFCTIGLWCSRQRFGGLLCLIAVVLLLCDQINWFYAVEARPYAGVALCVALCVLLKTGLLCNLRTLQRTGSILLAALAVYVHYTAWIVVVSLMTAGCSTALVRRDWLLLKKLVVDGVFVTVLVAPAHYELLRIGQNQSLWQSFASNTSFSNLRTLLPIDAWFGIAFCAWLVSTWKINKRIKFDSISILSLELGLAVIIGVLAIWFLAISSIAPLIHTRYMIGGYPLLVIASLGLLSAIQSRVLILIAACVMASAWMLTQGGPYLLRYGQAVVWQRQEDWPGAVHAIERQVVMNPKSKIAFAPMLVETKDFSTINKFGSQKLRYAITSAFALYRKGEVRDSVADCLLLSNQIEHWDSELQQTAWAADKSNSCIILSRAPAYRVLPWLERIASDMGMKAELLFGNPAQRLSVIQIQKNE